MSLLRGGISEDAIVRKLVDKLRCVGFDVFNNIRVGEVEIDVLALEHQDERPLVHVYEVKSRPKPKLVKQIAKRMDMADYIYVVVPLSLYPWVIKKLEPGIGLILYVNDDLYVFQKAEFLGRGMRVAKVLRYLDGCLPRLLENSIQSCLPKPCSSSLL